MNHSVIRGRKYLKKVSFESGIDIAQGYVPSYSAITGSRMELISQISSLLWQKFRQPLPPAFIGQIYIKEQLTIRQGYLFEAIKNVQREKSIPLLIRVSSAIQALQVLKLYQKQEISRKILAFFVENPNQDKYLSQLLSVPNITVCLGVLKPSGPTNNPYLYQEFFSNLLLKEWPAHLILTPNVMFRCNLRNFGGPGYSCSLDLFGLNKPTEFMKALMWYQKEEKAKVAIKYWECCWCKKSFPETQESYKKFNFEYCSIKCLSEHRKNNFKFN